MIEVKFICDTGLLRVLPTGVKQSHDVGQTIELTWTLGKHFT